VTIYLYNLALLLDQALNTLLCGSPDETLSSRAYRAYVKGRLFGRIFKPCIDALFFWQTSHCRHAYLAEVLRYQLPPDFLIDLPEANLP
jgi:hypothetical protein